MDYLLSRENDAQVVVIQFVARSVIVVFSKLRTQRFLKRYDFKLKTLTEMKIAQLSC